MLLIKKKKVYDALKYVALVLLPAAGTLYYGLAQIWGLPAGDNVVGSIVVVDTFLGILLHISNTQYQSSDAKYDGAVVVTGEDEGSKNFTLNVNGDLDTMHKKKELVFKVDNQTE